MRSSERRPAGRACRGFTLVEVLLTVVLLGLVGVSLTQAFGRLSQGSAQALRERQALALAEALLAEVVSMPFTYCDAQDARLATATGAFLGGTGCATSVDALGPEPGETRYGPANRFDHMTDYDGLAMPGPGCPAGLCDRNGALLNGPGSPLASCSARLSVRPVALPGLAALDAQGRPQALRVVASVTCDGRALSLETIRTRHAPNQG